MTLRHLLGEKGTGTTTLGDLAEHIASIENDKPRKALSSTERKRVYICLYQCHLPQMDDAGVIDFDDDRKTIEPAENAENVLAFLPETEGQPQGNGRGWTSVFGSFAEVVSSRIRNTRRG